jgi:hypothetical protein
MGLAIAVYSAIGGELAGVLCVKPIDFRPGQKKVE